MKTNFLRRRLAIFWMVGLWVIVVVVPSALAQEKRQFAGKWKANLAKSQRHPNHLFKSLTLVFEFTDDEVLVSYTGVNMGEKQESNTVKLHPDGKEHPIAEAPGFVEVTKWIGARILETVAKKDGKVVGESTYEISSDGSTLTAKIKSIDAKGLPFDQTIVFDRD